MIEKGSGRQHLDDFETMTFKLLYLVRIVGHEADTRDTQRAEHLVDDQIIAGVVRKPQGSVGSERIQSRQLKPRQASSLL